MSRRAGDGRPTAAGATAAGLALLVLLPLLVFAPSMRPGRVLATAGTERFLPWRASASAEELALPQMNRDGVRENLVYRAFLHRAVRRGEPAWWFPHSFCGIPFLALSHTQALYPPTLVAAAADPFASYGALVAFHLVAAGLGMWLWLRAAGASRGAALLAALAFAWNGMFATRHGHPQYVATGAWLPWIGLAVEWIATGWAARGAALAAVVVALTFLAGHPSIYVYGLYGIGAYALFALAWTRRPPAARGFALRRLLWLGLGLAIGAGLASTQLLATAELAGFSERADRSWSDLSAQVPHWTHLLRVLFPDLLGNPLDGSYESPSHTSYTAGNLYLGVLPLLLAGFGASAGRRGALAAALAAGALAVIYVPPLYRTALTLLPGFGFSRIDRLSIVFFLAASLAAGLGLDALRRSLPAPPRLAWRGPALCVAAAVAAALLAASAVPVARGAVLRGLALAVAAAAFLAAARLRPRARWLVPAAVALTAVDLVGYASRFALVRDTERLFRQTPALARLGAAPGPFRLARYGGPSRDPAILPANLPALFGLDDVHGFGPLHPRDLDRLVEAADGPGAASPWQVRPFARLETLEGPLLDLLQVRYVLSREPLASGQLRRVHGGDLEIYENPDPLPRARFAGAWRVVRDPERAVALLLSGAIDSRGTVLLERAPPLPAPQPGAPAAVPDAGSAVEIREYAPNRVRLRKRGPAAGLVVLADAHYPGWRARVDGEPAPVLRADRLFRAVPVGPGEREVELEYRPEWLPGALAATGLAALACAGLAALAWRDGRRAAAHR